MELAFSLHLSNGCLSRSLGAPGYCLGAPMAKIVHKATRQQLVDNGRGLT